MKQKFFFIISSLFLVFTLFVGAPVSQAITSESDYNIENQQKRKYVERIISFAADTVPPTVIFYESPDGYAGYLGRTSYYFDFDHKEYVGFYSGYLYDRPPYPYPVGVFLEE